MGERAARKAPDLPAGKPPVARIGRPGTVPGAYHASTPTSPRERRVSAIGSKALWTSWQKLWNGELAVADEIVAPSFVARFAPVGSGPDEVRGPGGLKRWIEATLTAFADHCLTSATGSLAHENMVVGRWIFRATYRDGALPAATGERVEYAGMDILRVESGRIVQYVLCADVLQELRLSAGGSSLNRVHFLQPERAVAKEKIGDRRGA